MPAAWVPAQPSRGAAGAGAAMPVIRMQVHGHLPGDPGNRALGTRCLVGLAAALGRGSCR